MAKYEQSMEGMLDVFLFETNELLEKLDEILIRTESDTLGEEDVGEIFRIMHTVKGSAAMMGLHNVSKLAHSLEDLFSIIREDPNVQFDKPALYELLYAGSDGMKNEIENLSDESVPLTDFTEQIAKNRAFAVAMKGEAPAAEAAPQHEAAAGKTGTAQTGRYTEGKDKSEKMDHWFAGFYPAENPQYTVVVLQDEQTQPTTGCATIFAEVCNAIYLLKSN